jgi:acyl-CoA reductase-like NAD-dependent aldehyde dehydrogenase
MGAICMIEHSEKLQNLVNDALEKGAEIAVRGSFGNLGEDAVDQFFPPTVLVNVNHTMRIMQEEVSLMWYIILILLITVSLTTDFLADQQAFGPILPIMKFDSDEDAIKLANDSKYGLGCAVFSGDQKRAIRIASRLHCGVGAINDFASSYMCQVTM